MPMSFTPRPPPKGPNATFRASSARTPRTRDVGKVIGASERLYPTHPKKPDAEALRAVQEYDRSQVIGGSTKAMPIEEFVEKHVNLPKKKAETIGIALNKKHAGDKLKPTPKIENMEEHLSRMVDLPLAQTAARHTQAARKYSLSRIRPPPAEKLTADKLQETVERQTDLAVKQHQSRMVHLHRKYGQLPPKVGEGHKKLSKEEELEVGRRLCDKALSQTRTLMQQLDKKYVPETPTKVISHEVAAAEGERMMQGLHALV